MPKAFTIFQIELISRQKSFKIFLGNTTVTTFIFIHFYETAAQQNLECVGKLCRTHKINTLINASGLIEK